MNLKQQSVLADLGCDTIFGMLLAMAIVYTVATGPFWILVNSDCHYMDLFKHIHVMLGNLQSVTCPESVKVMLQGYFLPCLLDSFILDPTTLTETVEEAAKIFSHDEILQCAVVIVTTELLVVIRRQMADFLVVD